MRLHPDRIIATIAAGQNGCVTFAQLIGAGLTRGEIEHRIRTGRLRRRFRGVYVVAHDAPIPLQEERAALLSAGLSAAAVRRSAAFVWTLLSAPPREVELTVPGAHRTSREGIRFFHGVEQSDITEYRGLAVCSIPRLLLDICSEGESSLARRLMNEARVKRLLSSEELERFLEISAGRRGHPVLHAMVRGPRRTGMSRSKAERIMRRLIDRAGLPRPLANHHVLGEERDFVWLRERFVVEIDGWAAHGTRASFGDDRRRDADLVAAGWVVQRFTWDDLMDRPEWVTARVAAGLATRVPRLGA